MFVALNLQRYKFWNYAFAEIMRHADVSMAGEGVYLVESQLDAWDNYQVCNDY